MVENINIFLILVAGFIAMASPGPATLAIAGTSVSNGRPYGLALAAGVTSGSILWSAAAALGLGALMAANAWAFEILRYCGAAYLLFLAIKSAKSALRPRKGFHHSARKTHIAKRLCQRPCLAPYQPQSSFIFRLALRHRYAARHLAKSVGTCYRCASFTRRFYLFWLCITVFQRAPRRRLCALAPLV